MTNEIRAAFRNEADIELIKRVVAVRYMTTVEAIMSRSRKSELVWPRHVAMSIARRITGATLSEIGRCFNRHHADVIYACRSVIARCETCSREMVSFDEAEVQCCAVIGESLLPEGEKL